MKYTRTAFPVIRTVEARRGGRDEGERTAGSGTQLALKYVQL
jgi:hypothetical protein